MRFKQIISLTTIFILIIFGCSTKDNEDILIQAPQLNTHEISEIDAPNASCGGTIIEDGGSSITEQGICWSTNPEPTIYDYKTIENKDKSDFSSKMTHLKLNTIYYVRAYAKNKETIGYGNTKSFIAIMVGTVAIATEAVSNIGSRSVKASAIITNTSTKTVTEQGYCWSTSSLPTIADNKMLSTLGGNNFQDSIKNLNINTSYYIRAFMKVNDSIYYGNEESFKTRDGIPSLSTKQASNINLNDASLGGSITDDGGSSITSFGICWSTSPNPTIANNKLANSSNISDFNTSITSLTPNTTYYVRVFAINQETTAYGNEISFKTKDGIPVISTKSVDSIDIITANCGGNIISDGGSAITSRGVCWSTQTNPTTTDNKTVDGSGIGNFSSKLTNLAPNTTYYVRAYTTNAIGTQYANETSFTTEDGVIDYDGNAYHIIKIGNQTWLAENLKVTHYNDGTAIPNITNDNTWMQQTSGSYCWHSNAITNKKTYGALYNWYAANNVNIAPKGWHVPSDSEWSSLFTYLGGESVAGEKMKESSALWNASSTPGTNTSGFNGKPGHARGTNTSGEFLALGTVADWWSATSYASNNSWAWYMAIAYDSKSINHTFGTKYSGMSIRCIKD